MYIRTSDAEEDERSVSGKPSKEEASAQGTESAACRGDGLRGVHFRVLLCAHCRLGIVFRYKPAFGLNFAKQMYQYELNREAESIRIATELGF